MAKMDELLSNLAFMEKVAATATAEEAIELFRKEGLQVTEEELLTVFAAPVEGENGELSEDSMESVTGGSVWWGKKIKWPPVWWPRPRVPRILGR